MSLSRLLIKTCFLKFCLKNTTQDFWVISAETVTVVTMFCSLIGFAYCFPFIKCVLKDGGAAVGKDENILLKALNITSTHAQLRNPPDDGDKSFEEPNIVIN